MTLLRTAPAPNAHRPVSVSPVPVSGTQAAATRPAASGARRRLARVVGITLASAAIITGAGLVAAQGDPAGGAAMPRAQHAVPRLGDCNLTSHHALLEAAPPAAAALFSQARGQWMDARHLRWPGVAAEPGTRFRLLHSAAGQLLPQPGTVVRGADGAVELAVHTDPLLPALESRFRWAGAGVTLRLPEAELARVPAMLRRQLALVHEDAAGRVLRSTALQIAGVLDEVYAAAEQVHDLGVQIYGNPALAGSLTALRPRPDAAPGRDVPVSARAGSPLTRFKLWAPTAERVALCLYPDGRSPAQNIVIMQRDAATGVWLAERPGNLTGRYYTYLVDVHVRGVGRVRNLVTDPYAISVGIDSRRAYIADLDDPQLAPPGWAETRRPPPPADIAEMVNYALHVREFSIGDSSVSLAHRGKYRAFTEAQSAGMRHLRALREAGLTDVQLLPLFDGVAVPDSGCVTPDRNRLAAMPPASDQQQALVMATADRDCFSWGDAPFHFSAPEGSYASSAADGAVRIRELRQMVLALHRLGLRVGMDVAYSRTTASGQHARSVLDRIVPGYYHRLDTDGRVQGDRRFAHTATEHRMMAKLMTDSAIVWARDHRIDSFRFDQMAQHPREVMERLQLKIDLVAGRPVPLIGEGWQVGQGPDGARFVPASLLSLYGSGIATFSDRARDAIRGGSAVDPGGLRIFDPGWISGLHGSPTEQESASASPGGSRTALMHAADLVRVGLAGTLRDYEMVLHGGERLPLSRVRFGNQPAGYAARPGEVVNAVERASHLTLFDALVFKLPPGTPPHERARVQTLGAALVALSQGAATFQAGQEILRSKSLDGDSRDSGDWFNRLDWTLTDNGFGAGLPPAPHNASGWPLMRPLLADPTIKPRPEDIRFARNAFLDLLRIRNSSSLFRLGTADEVRQRLSFFNTGPQQEPTVIVGHLDGRGHPDANFDAVLYAVNADVRSHTLDLPELRGQMLVLHPVHRAEVAADTRPREQARWDPIAAQLTVPPRTALVYVAEPAR